MYNLIVQLIGIVAMLLCLLCYHFKKRQHLLITKLLADILWALHYILIGGVSAFLTNVVCTMRETVYLVDKSEKRRPLQLIFFLALIWILVIIFNKGAAGVLPAVASSLGTYSFWQKSITKTRIIALLIAILMFTYDIFFKSYAGLINESFTMISVIIAMINAKRYEKNS
ncbi:MAG: YgjV family protein [Ruminococcaceae bacterium]|nr:YgjV family protein [Oscillospiraceae bacterium]